MKVEKTYFDLLLILLMGLVPLLWFRDGYNAIAGFDFAVYLNPVETLKKSYYLWSDMMAGGYDISHEISSVPYYFLFSVPVLFGASLYTAEKFVFVAIFTLQGLSIYYMLSVLFEKTEARRAIALTGAVIYTFSYPVMAHFGRGNMMALLTYGLLPLLIGLLYRGFTRPQEKWKYIMLVSLLSLPVSATKGHPADFVVLIGVVFYFVVFNIAVSKNKAHIIFFSAKTFAASLLVNLWWVVPNIVYLRDFGLSSTDLVKEGFYNLDILSYYSRGTSIFNVLRNERLDLWFDIPQDMLLNPGLYQNGLFIMIGLMMPVVAFIAVCVARRNKQVFFFSSLSLMAVFMGKGSHEPFGGLFEWMYMHLPGFFFFRAPYRIFSSLLTFALAPLIAFTVGSVVNSMLKSRGTKPVAGLKRGLEAGLTFYSFKKVVTGLFVFFFFSASLAYAWPIFTGAHLRENGSPKVPGVFHSIPPEYSEADKWLRGQKGAFKVYYPYEVYDANTTWGYNGPDPSFELLSVPKVVSRPGGTVYVRYQRPIEALNKILWDFRYGDLKKILSFYNVRYALLHEDFNRWVMPDYNFNIYADSLFKANSMVLTKKIGLLSFYENGEFLQKVYAAQKSFLLAGDEGSFPALSLAGYLDSPFLVMARDIDARGINRTLESVDGIVFYNSNAVDLVCDLLERSYGRPAQESLRFTADKRGLYYVFVKDTDRPLELKNANPDKAGSGLSWRKFEVKDLKEGEQLLKFANAGPRQRVLIVPEEVFKEVKSLVDRRLQSPEFDAAYIFNRDAQQRTEVSLQGKTEYLLSLNIPVRYSKKKVDAWKQGVLKPVSEKTGASLGRKGESIQNNGFLEYYDKVSKKSKTVDIGEYPKLVLNKKSFSSKKVMISMDLDLDGGRVHEKMTAVEATVPESGEIDLSEIAKKRYSAGVYELKRIEIGFKAGNEIKKIETAVFPGPELVGEFDLTKMSCQGAGLSFKVRGQISAIRAAKCGEWSKDIIVKPSRYSIENTPAGLSEYLVIFKKKVTEGRPKNARLVEFEKINPTKYLIRAGHDVEKLVFSDSYNSGWSLHSSGERFSPFKVNGYANGFIIRPGGKIMTLEYEPQRFFDYSKLASLGSLAAVVISGGLNSRKKGKQL